MSDTDNNTTNTGTGGTGRTAREEEMMDVRLRATTVAMHAIVEQIERDPATADWPESRKMQVGYEAAGLVLGTLDGHAMIDGIERARLDSSLRDGMTGGRRAALAMHDDGCPGCRGGTALRRMLEAN